MTLCNCKCSCTAAAVIASIIVGVLAAFLQITAVITVTPVFLWVAAGVAAVYLGILLLRGGCCGGEGRPCACAALNFILKPYLDDAHKDGINAEQLIIGHGYEDEDLVGGNYMILGRIFKVVAALQPTGTGMDSTFFMDFRTAQDVCLESEVLRENWTKRDPHDYISVIMIKKEYKGFMVITAICGVLLFVIFNTSFIGVCANGTMRCQVTKVWGIGVAAVAFVTSLLNLLSGKEGQVPG